MQVIYRYDALDSKFTGKERDTESGNDYFGARYYSSAMGRWMSPV
jgi:RHS repeat-associated protein